MLKVEKVKGESERGSACSLQVSGLSSPLLLVGSDSMIGSALANEAKARRISFYGSSRRPGALWHLDLSDSPDQWGIPSGPSLAILCAAVTSLQACETDPVGTSAINTQATIELADRLADQGADLVFISSSRVFPPTMEYPTESTPPAPTTEYGRQKLAVEEYLLGKHPTAKIIRPAKIVTPTLQLVQNWLNLLAKKHPISPFYNLYFSPISSTGTAQAILQIALSPTPGIFHLSASDSISYFDAAKQIAHLLAYDPDLIVPMNAPQPNTPGSSILSCLRTVENSCFRPATSLENLRSAFARLKP